MFIVPVIINILFDPDVAGPSTCPLSSLQKVPSGCNSQLFMKTVAIEYN